MVTLLIRIAGSIRRIAPTAADLIWWTAMPIFFFTASFIVGLLMACVEFGRGIRPGGQPG
jgi:hypothetical protein